MEQDLFKLFKIGRLVLFISLISATDEAVFYSTLYVKLKEDLGIWMEPMRFFLRTDLLLRIARAEFFPSDLAWSKFIAFYVLKQRETVEFWLIRL
jgi:hypothetical protein